MRRLSLPSVALCGVLILTACRSSPTPEASSSSAPPTTTGSSGIPTATALPGMPPLPDPRDVYAADRPGNFSPVVKDFPSLIYVPNSDSNAVDIIDPAKAAVVSHFAVGRQPQHVDLSNTLTPIDPATGKPGEPIAVSDPYNMYFTPDGQAAIIVAERLQRLDFRDPHTMVLAHSLPVACPGVDHMDFSADGTYLVASCEFGGSLIKVDVAHQRVVGSLGLPKHGKLLGKPQDVKLSPDGKVFYVADMNANGVYLIDGEAMKVLGFLPTGANTHGLYVSRDSKYLYVSNRGEGTVSVVDFATRKIATTWRVPGGGSPDMGGVSADGTTLWLSGRYNSEVYAFDTSNGKVVTRIKVGKGPHGLCVYPQPGRYSLGHTGILR